MQNNQPAFIKKIPGKWILAGEHTVLRGGDAIVFPLQSQYLEISFAPAEHSFTIELAGEDSTEIKDIVNRTFERALESLKVAPDAIRGKIILRSNIQFGAGMGASATLCVAVGELLRFLGLVSDQTIYDFCRQLENIFHGESSGVDVAVVLRQRPLLFSRANGAREIQNYQLPKLFLSHTGQQGITKDCVQQVKSLMLKNPQAALAIDQRMMKAVKQFTEILNGGPIDLWRQTMELAHSCFEDWGLVNEAVRKHAAELKSHGALAIKLTGSGSGGFMLSLWENEPQNIPFAMISCQKESL